MYCRNCGNEVNDKAIACPKCGVNPKSEKNYCPSCGVATNSNQILCTSCGVSLASASPLAALKNIDIPQVDINGILKNKALIFAAVGLIGFFMTWLKYSASAMGIGGAQGYSGSGMSDILQTPQLKTILVSVVLYLFPLSLLGVILSFFVEQIAKYSKAFAITALVVVIYAGIGIFTTKIEVPEQMKSMMDMANTFTGNNGGVKTSFSAGFGYYVSLIAAAATVYFISKKQ